MKEQVKQIVIALVVLILGAALLVAGFRWYTRPLPLSMIFSPVQEGLQCGVVLERYGYGAPENESFDLDPSQIQQLLDRLAAGRYSRPPSALTDWFTNSVTGVPVTIEPSARLFFSQQDGQETELMLCGEILTVNYLGQSGGKDGNYHTQGGAAFQQDIVDWLADISNTARSI